MSTEAGEAPLLRTSSEQSSIGREQTGRRGREGLKVAGITLLAAVLIAGQAVTLYMVHGQREQLSSLQRRSDRLQEISRKTFARAPLKMNLPMSPLVLTLDESKVKDSSPSPKPVPSVQTRCQREASGEAKTLVPSFRPRCDGSGQYLPEQCWDRTGICWCVDVNGVEILDSLTNGPASCASAYGAPEPVLMSEVEQ